MVVFLFWEFLFRIFLRKILGNFGWDFEFQDYGRWEFVWGLGRTGDDSSVGLAVKTINKNKIKKKIYKNDLQKNFEDGLKSGLVIITNNFQRKVLTRKWFPGGRNFQEKMISYFENEKIFFSNFQKGSEKKCKIFFWKVKISIF